MRSGDCAGQVAESGTSRGGRRRDHGHMRWLAALTSVSLVAAAGCSGQTSTTSHRTSTSSPPQAGPVSSVIGMTPAQAEQAALRSGLAGVSVDAEAVTDSSPPDTVVGQSGRGGQLLLTVAAPPSPSCTAAQLGAAYVGGGLATGNDMGNVVVRDVSQNWCTLSGSSQVTGLNTAGVVVTNTVGDPIPAPIVLSPNAPAPANAHSQSQPPLPLGVIEADLFFSAEYRDGPQPNGLCDTLQVVPATWRVVLPGPIVIVTKNSDPSNVQGGFTQFTTCQGRMNIPTPPMPVQVFADP